MTARLSWRTSWQFLADLIPYAAITAIICLPMLALARCISQPWLLLAAQGACGIAAYLGANAALGSKIQAEALLYLRQMLKKER